METVFFFIVVVYFPFLFLFFPTQGEPNYFWVGGEPRGRKTAYRLGLLSWQGLAQGLGVSITSVTPQAVVGGL